MPSPVFPAARGYTWEPFKDGNTVAYRHGAFSDRFVTEASRPLVDDAYSECSWLRPVDLPEVVAWARAEAAARMLSDFLEREGMFDANGNPRKGPLYWLDKFEAAAARRRNALGLNPLARARLGRDVTATQVDVARLLSGMDDRPSAHQTPPGGDPRPPPPALATKTTDPPGTEPDGWR